MSTLAFDQADQIREFFFAMLESIPGGLLLADRQGALLAANQQATAMLGLAGSAIQGRSCWEILARALELDGDEAAPLQRPGGRILVERPTPGGESRYFLLSRNELKSPFLAVDGFFLSLEDVTYPAMIEAHQERRQRFAAIQEMTVYLSQELRNPLGGLELYVSMLRRDLGDDPDYQRITARMLAAIRTISHLLDNALTFAAQPRPAKEQVAIRPWLDGVLAELAPLGEEKGVRFIPRYQHQGEEISGDPVLLHQLMLNLGLNALESMEQAGEIELTSRTLPASQENPATLEIKWIDQGRGIAPEARGRIFDPFYTTKERGKGLGLAIVHHIVESHQGLIRVDRGPGGRGSVFSVFLPYGARD